MLRDIPALTRSLEDAFWGMQSEGERGATPVPDLTNLDVYCEIGAALDLENIELLDDAPIGALRRQARQMGRVLAASRRRPAVARSRRGHGGGDFACIF